jgi:hypothetical protein
MPLIGPSKQAKVQLAAIPGMKTFPSLTGSGFFGAMGRRLRLERFDNE